ncbi:MAG TPA: hypothetical protein VHF22_09125 [Planctomycetota bacterium]|nr:hypothetical protein [Planctomycetota bacterium]
MGQQSRTDAAVATVTRSDTSLGAWLGAHLGVAEGVLAVYYCYEPASASRPAAHRVWSILKDPRSTELREALRAREAAAAAKFPELRFEFDVTDRADPPALGAKLVYSA